MHFGETEKKIYESVKLPENTKPGSITSAIMSNKVLEALRTAEEFQDLEKILDYALIKNRDIRFISYDLAWNSRVMAVVNTGGSEGIYIDWFLWRGSREEEPFIKLGTLKTLDEGFEGYKKMGEISGMLVMATEAFIYENDDLFYGEKK